MINSIQAGNFQSHKDLFLKLHPGVNAIIGPSDSGKTAIFRLLNWIINNKPAGDEFRSWWGGGTSGYIDLEEGFLIGRIKTDSDNLYTVTKADGSEDEYRAFGQAVPEDIQKILNISDINFRFQHDSPFLLGQSAGTNARYFNNLVNLDLIDKALYNINHRLKDEKNRLQNKEDSKLELEKKLKEYEWLDDADTKLKETEELDRRLQYAKKEYRELDELSSNFKAIKKRLKDINEVLKFKEKIDELLIIDKKIDQLCEEESRLKGLKEELIKVKSKIKRCNKIIAYENKVMDLLAIEQEIRIQENKRDRLSKVFKEYSELKYKLEMVSNKLNKTEDEFNRLMPNVCPLCGQEVRDE